MSLSSLLPAPSKTYGILSESSAPSLATPSAPPARPLASVLAVQPSFDAASGEVRLDSSVSGSRGGVLVKSRFSDIVPRGSDSGVIRARPSAAEVDAATARTAAALGALVSTSVAALRPGNQAAVAAERATSGRADTAQIIQYTPDEDAPGFNPATRSRVIKIVEAPVDPLEPPKFRQKKMAPGPADAPAPVLHSPSRKVTPEDAAAWKIPPSVSNYKNPKGFVIPLDKRIAADGRHLLEPEVGDGFAKLSEALLIAERKSRVEVETRAAIQKRLDAQAKEGKEAELRALAARARLERTGVVAASAASGGGAFGAKYTALAEADMAGDTEHHEERAAPGARRDIRPAWLVAQEATGGSGGAAASSAGLAAIAGYDDDDDDDGAGGGVESTNAPLPQAAGESAADYTARVERERARREFRREKEREMRGAAAKGRAGKFARDGDRDVSERVALGVHTGAGGGAGGEALFDARLFNQHEGLRSGFAGDEEYEAYDKSWRGGGGDGAVASGIYRPRAPAAGGTLGDAEAAGELDALAQGAAKRFRTEDGGAVDFEGVPLARGGGGGGAARPAGPVLFERAAPAHAHAAAAAPADDPFGIDAFLTEPKKRAGAGLENVGARGFLAAAGGGGGGGAPSGRTEVKFSRG